MSTKPVRCIGIRGVPAAVCCLLCVVVCLLHKPVHGLAETPNSDYAVFFAPVWFQYGAQGIAHARPPFPK
jgi:hypothetical protein